MKEPDISLPFGEGLRLLLASFAAQLATAKMRLETLDGGAGAAASRTVSTVVDRIENLLYSNEKAIARDAFDLNRKEDANAQVDRPAPDARRADGAGEEPHQVHDMAGPERAKLDPRYAIGKAAKQSAAQAYRRGRRRSTFRRKRRR